MILVQKSKRDLNTSGLTIIAIGAPTVTDQHYINSRKLPTYEQLKGVWAGLLLRSLNQVTTYGYIVNNSRVFLL